MKNLENNHEVLNYIINGTHERARLITVVVVLVFTSLTAMSCKDGKNGNTHDSAMTNQTASETEVDHSGMTTANEESSTKQVLADYMLVKDALVATNQTDAAKASTKLMASLKGFSLTRFDAEHQKELGKILKEAQEQAKLISTSEMKSQREQFKKLTISITALVSITGTDTTVYQQYCPMYDGGTAWLSMSKDIKNPYYGDKMLTCGKVQKEIN